MPMRRFTDGGDFVVKDLQEMKVPAVLTIETILAEKYLDHFIKQAWHVLEPTTPYIHGWHIDAMAEHLMAVTMGDIHDLLINVPPRHSKSLTVSVFWPAWEWLQHPSTRWLFSSYAQELSTRDSLKCRQLIQSPWYQERWGHLFQLDSDNNQKMKFTNNKTGARMATSVEGANTGEGGDRIVADDPHNVHRSESDVKRQGVIQWWREVMSTRLNDPKTGSKVVVMQRVHEDDLSAYMIDNTDCAHLCLPAEYEGNRVRTCIPLGNPFSDPRSVEGELLWPAKIGPVELKKMKEDLGAYATAGQLQQSPHPRGGGIFPVDKFVKLDQMPPVKPVRSIRYWDKAGTEKKGSNKPARTAGVLMHLMPEGHKPRYVISDSITGYWEFGKRNKIIRDNAPEDGVDVEIHFEQEPGSSGKESAAISVIDLAGYKAYASVASGDKVTRAEPYASQVEVGNVGIVVGPWSRDFIDEHRSFPVGRLKDQVDAASGAFNKLTLPKNKVKRVGTWGSRDTKNFRPGRFQ